jgi:acetyl esterase/lipase
MERAFTQLRKSAGSWRLLFLFFILQGCQILDVIQPEANYINEPNEGYKLWKDVIFSNQKEVRLDLYQPLSKSDHPAEVVILLHGGGWTSGDKFFLKPTLDHLMKAKKNLAIVNMNYRVSSDASNLLSVQLEDIQMAIEFLQKNADTYKIRKNNYRLAGFSAGGHIALTHAYMTKETCIKTVIGFSAPTELCIKEMLTKSLWPRVETLTGKKYSDSTDVFKLASPFYLATARSPRTVLIYGVNDTLVSPRQGELLAQKLTLLRVPTSFKVYAGENHEITPWKAASCILESYQ